MNDIVWNVLLTDLLPMSVPELLNMNNSTQYEKPIDFPDVGVGVKLV